MRGGSRREQTPRPFKVSVEGLHARFLLEAFLAHAGREMSTLQASFDGLLAELTCCARYLGLERNAQMVLTEQLGAISMLRDFANALLRCAGENAAREALKESEAKQAAAKEAREAAKEAAKGVAKGVAKEQGPTAASPRLSMRPVITATAVAATSSPVLATVVKEAWVPKPSPVRYTGPDDEYF